MGAGSTAQRPLGRLARVQTSFNQRHEQTSRKLAEQNSVELPPVAKEPRWWPRFLQPLSGPPLELPANPKGILFTLLCKNKGLLLLAALIASVSQLSSALLAWALGKLLDSGLELGFGPHLVQPVLVFFGLVLVATISTGLYQVFEISTWLQGQMNTARVSAHHVANRRGQEKPDMATGDIIATITTDSNHIGAAFSYVPDLIASVVSTAVIAYLMLSVSVPLGLVVVIGMPVVVGALSLLVKPLQQRQQAQREAQGDLTNIGTDVVTGLRVLRGIGGEDVFNERYRELSQEVRRRGVYAANPQSVLSSASQGLPQAFALAVVAIAAFLVLDGKLTAGEMIAFYGFAGYLMHPLFVVVGAMQVGTRAWVGLRKVARVLSLESTVNKTESDSEDAAQRAKPQAAGKSGADTEESAQEARSEDADSGSFGQRDRYAQVLRDGMTGLEFKPGIITALVAEDPDVSAKIATRISRIDDEFPVFIGATDLRDLPINEVRDHIVLASADDHLFSGTLRENLLADRAAPREPLTVQNTIFETFLNNRIRQERPLEISQGDADDRLLLDAIHTADAQDVLDSIPGGLDGVVAEKGRTLSGGQRQRVALARAVATNAEVMIAIEPTSAVDSHTESRIAHRLRERRENKTTVLVTASPLVLDQCDEVIVVDEQGREIARGMHRELMQRAAESDPSGLQYQHIVQRVVGGVQ